MVIIFMAAIFLFTCLGLLRLFAGLLEAFFGLRPRDWGDLEDLDDLGDLDCLLFLGLALRASRRSFSSLSRFCFLSFLACWAACSISFRFRLVVSSSSEGASRAVDIRHVLGFSIR